MSTASMLSWPDALYWSAVTLYTPGYIFASNSISKNMKPDLSHATGWRSCNACMPVCMYE